jgi:glycosyltransferase involved in cell wall biosynthesis
MLGNRVTVYARRDAPRLPDRADLPGGVRVEHLLAGPARPLPEEKLLSQVPALSERLAERWRREPPDVVHAVRWTGGLAALAGARGLGIPVVQTFHSLGVTERRGRSATDDAPAARIRLESAIARTASAVVVPSSAEVQDLAGLGVPRHSIKVVPWGVDTEEFAPEGPAATRGSRARLLAVSTLSDRKELDTLLLALAGVPEAELVVAGWPPQAQLRRHEAHRSLAWLASALGISDRVMFAGWPSRSAMPALLRSADLLVSVSWQEQSAMVAVEAMACGTPVVAAAVGGHPDIVADGITGVLVPPGRPSLLAIRIRELLADPVLLSAYGIAAGDRARSRYSWDRIGRETLAVYGSARA